MKADVVYHGIGITHTSHAVEGKSISEILDKVCNNLGLSEKGRTALTYTILATITRDGLCSVCNNPIGAYQAEDGQCCGCGAKLEVEIGGNRNA